jgi:HEAT repeat protein
LDRVRAALAKYSAEGREDFLREFEDDKKTDARDKGKDKGKSGSRDDCDDEIRITAVNSLLQMDPERAMPILEKVLLNRDQCPELREKALFVVSQHGGDESLRLILDVAKNDPDPDLREKAVFWLSQMPGEASFNAIVEFLNDATEPNLQEQAVFALSQHQSARAAAILRDVAGNKRYSIGVREKAIFWLSQTDARDSVPFLIKLYGDLDDPDLREKVIFSISQSQSPESEAWLRGRAMDPKEDLELRKKALFWLSNNGSLSCDDMLKLYSTFSEREMREQILFGLSQLDDACAVDALIRIVHTEKDDELVEKAVFWLGQTGDDKALKLLEELIDKGRGGGR